MPARRRSSRARIAYTRRHRRLSTEQARGSKDGYGSGDKSYLLLERRCMEKHYEVMLAISAILGLPAEFMGPN